MYACDYCGGMREPGYFVCPHCRTQNGTPYFQAGNGSIPPANYHNYNQRQYRNHNYNNRGFNWLGFFMFFVLPITIYIIALIIDNAN